MLNLYIEDENNKVYCDRTKVTTDIEERFKGEVVEHTPLIEVLMREIEGASYNDPISFIDRFGYKLTTRELSTGCKAAILVATYPDEVFDLLECGNNARDSILRHCKDGNVIVRDNGYDFGIMPDDEIDICLDGCRFRTGGRLYTYMEDQRGFPNEDLSDVKLT